MARREIERFEAVDGDGARYTVVKLRNLVPFKDTKGNITHSLGGETFELLDGRHVNPKNSVTFQIYDTDEIIRKVV